MSPKLLLPLRGPRPYLIHYIGHICPHNRLCNSRKSSKRQHWLLKGKVCYTHNECRQGAHLTDSGQCDASPTVTFPAVRHHYPMTGIKLYYLVEGAHVWTTCPRILPESETAGTHDLWSEKSKALATTPPGPAYTIDWEAKLNTNNYIKKHPPPSLVPQVAPVLCRV